MALAGSSARELAGASFQNASAQILVMEKMVKRPTTRRGRDKDILLGFQTWLCTIINFAKKPESGGTPANESAGIRNRIDRPALDRVNASEFFQFVSAAGGDERRR